MRAFLGRITSCAEGAVPKDWRLTLRRARSRLTIVALFREAKRKRVTRGCNGPRPAEAGTHHRRALNRQGIHMMAAPLYALSRMSSIGAVPPLFFVFPRMERPCAVSNRGVRRGRVRGPL